MQCAHVACGVVARGPGGIDEFPEQLRCHAPPVGLPGVRGAPPDGQMQPLRPCPGAHVAGDAARRVRIALPFVLGEQVVGERPHLLGDVELAPHLRHAIATDQRRLDDQLCGQVVGPARAQLPVEAPELTHRFNTAARLGKHQRSHPAEAELEQGLRRGIRKETVQRRVVRGVDEPAHGEHVGAVRLRLGHPLGLLPPHRQKPLPVRKQGGRRPGSKALGGRQVAGGTVHRLELTRCTRRNLRRGNGCGECTLERLVGQRGNEVLEHPFEEGAQSPLQIVECLRAQRLGGDLPVVLHHCTNQGLEQLVHGLERRTPVAEGQQQRHDRGDGGPRLLLRPVSGDGRVRQLAEPPLVGEPLRGAGDREVQPGLVAAAQPRGLLARAFGEQGVDGLLEGG